MLTQLEQREVPAIISGTAFYDTNANGILDTGESCESGMAVLCSPEGGTPLQTTTDAQGQYGFANLGDGKHTVSFTPPTGATFITPVSGYAEITLGSAMTVLLNATLMANSPPVSPPPVFPPPISPPPPPSPSSGLDNHWQATNDFDWQRADNWSLGHAPLPSENVYFGISGTTSTTNAGAGSAGTFNSLHVLASYAQTITMAMPLSVGVFEMSPGTGGKIDQPQLGYDLTITTTMNWTSGTINSTAVAANLILSGATALIAPQGVGVISTGSRGLFPK